MNIFKLIYTGSSIIVGSGLLLGANLVITGLHDKLENNTKKIIDNLD